MPGRILGAVEMQFLADISPNGGVVLGGMVVCDGFFANAAVRVQTHIHADHMTDFESSKGYHTILMSEPTKELLVVELNAELAYRTNVIAIPTGQPYEVEEFRIDLLPSGHMLGSTQVVVTLNDGARVAYSGDFNWPLHDVVKTDVLVVDSTYGSPLRGRRYSQSEVDERLIELVLRQLRQGAVHVKAHRGTLERALEILDGAIQVPVIATQKLCKEVDVYRRFGYQIEPLLDISSDDAQHHMAEGQYLRLYGIGEGDLFGIEDGTAINLSAYMASSTDPVLEFSPRAFRVAMTCHADFEGTLRYIEATGAKHVITDNYRGGHAVELAKAVRSELGIDAAPSQLRPSRYWGE